MDDDLLIQILLIVMLMLFACFCAASEIAFASINRMQTQSKSKLGDKKATKALVVLDNFDNALITLLVGNNITHIGIASISTLIATRVWGIESVKYSTIVITIIIFFASELVPKSYAKSNSSMFAFQVSGFLLLLMKLFLPFTKVFLIWKRFITKLLPSISNSHATDEDLMNMVEVAHSEGGIEEAERILIQSAIEFEAIKVKDVYININDVVVVSEDDSMDEITSIIQKNRFSRIPVYDKQYGQVIGFLQTLLYLKHLLQKKDTDVKNHMLKPVVVNENVKINDLLTDMSSSKYHMAMVENDNHDYLGIVTLEDILEELVGEIWDEDDHVFLESQPFDIDKEVI